MGDRLVLHPGCHHVQDFPCSLVRRRRPIDIDLAHSAVVFRPARTGRHRIGACGDVGLPASVRTMAGLQQHQTVLLVAFPVQDVLVLHPAGTVTRLLAAMHRRILGELA